MNIAISSDLTPEDFQAFKEFFVEAIMSWYPDTTLKTADSIIAKHKLGFDSVGYFTKKKTIWKGTDETNNTVAFTVTSEKRGGSVKFGPTMVDKEKRNRGIGSAFRLLVENYYQDLGFRKAYSTANIKNRPGINYILKIGYKIELHLKRHYSKATDEVVLSRMLNPPSVAEKTSVIENYPKYITDYMDAYYDDIDNTYFENINKTATTNHSFTENCYIGKRKYVFQNDSERLYAVVFPKRGGCAKISSLILNDNEISSTDFVRNLIDIHKNTPVHKLYTFIPAEKYNDVLLLKKLGFFTEGIIAEPYKRNIDLIMLSFFM